MILCSASSPQARDGSAGRCHTAQIRDRTWLQSAIHQQLLQADLDAPCCCGQGTKQKDNERIKRRAAEMDDRAGAVRIQPTAAARAQDNISSLSLLFSSMLLCLSLYVCVISLPLYLYLFQALFLSLPVCLACPRVSFASLPQSPRRSQLLFARAMQRSPTPDTHRNGAPHAARRRATQTAPHRGQQREPKERRERQKERGKEETETGEWTVDKVGEKQINPPKRRSAKG